MKMHSNSEEKKLLDCPGLPDGWKREVVPRKTGAFLGRIDVYYYSPMGAKCRSKPEMSRILGEKFDLSTFDYRNCNFDGKKRKAPSAAAKEQIKKRKKATDTEKGKLMKANAKALRDDSAYSCPTCGRGFRNDTTLVSHILVHVRKSSFVCHFCDKAFYSANKVKIHLKRHIRKRPVLSAEGFPFYDEEEEKREKLKIIQNGHEEVKTTGSKKQNSLEAKNERLKQDANSSTKPTCPECGKTYMTKTSLKYHMMNHTGEKPYKCDQCDQSFSQRESLEEHAKSHTETNSGSST